MKFFKNKPVEKQGSNSLSIEQLTVVGRELLSFIKGGIWTYMTTPKSDKVQINPITGSQFA